MRVTATPLLPFQLTAARRRLRGVDASGLAEQLVSTHSRPKAAAESSMVLKSSEKFQLTAARRRLHPAFAVALFLSTFQLTAARRRLRIILTTISSSSLFQLTAARRRLRQGTG